MSGLLLEEHHDLPLCDLRLVVRTGAAHDPPGRAGLARHAALLMRRGAGRRSRVALDGALDALGGWLEVEVTHDHVVIAGRALRAGFGKLVQIAADVLARPRFEPVEHECLARETLAVLEHAATDDEAICGRALDERVLAGHPYAADPLGSPARLCLADIAAWHAAHVARGAVLVGFAGDVDRIAAERFAAQLVSALPERPSSTHHALPPLPRRTDACTLRIGRSGRTQAHVMFGTAAPPFGDPAWLALEVAATLLGGAYSSRLVTEVRVKRGLAYRVEAKLGRTLQLHVVTDATRAAETVAVVRDVVADLVARGVTEEEVARARQYLAGRYLFARDTAEKRLQGRLEAEVVGIPYDRAAQLREVEVADVERAVREWLDPKSLVTVITGTIEPLAALSGR